MTFICLPLQKSPLLNMGIQERDFQNGEDFKNLKLHAVCYCYYMQFVTAITYYSSLLRAMRLLPLR